MAIAFDVESQSGQVTSNPITLSLTTSANNELIFIGIQNQNAGGILSITVNGTAPTLIGSQAVSGGGPTVYLYAISAPTTTNVLSVTRNTGTAQWSAFMVAYSGASLTGVPDNATSGVGGTSTMTGTLTTVANNCWTIMTCYDGNQGLAASTGSTVRGSIVVSAYGIFDSNGPKTPAGSTSQAVTVNQLGGTAYVMASFAPVASAVANGNFLAFM